MRFPHEVPNMTQIRNENIEVRKTKYFHLQGLSFWMSIMTGGPENFGMMIKFTER